MPVYLSAVYLTQSLISLCVTDRYGNALYNFTSARSSLQPYKAYPLWWYYPEQRVTQYRGWIVFGSYINKVLPVHESYLFMDGVNQSAIETKALNIQKTLPVHTLYTSRKPLPIGATAVSSWGYPTSGIMKILPSNGITTRATYDSLTNKTTIWLGLAPEAQTIAASPCAGGTSADNCKLPAIKSINGIKPDAQGKIWITFDGTGP
jgi:hypothetical protein